MLKNYTREDLAYDWQDLKAVWQRFRDDVLPIIEDFLFTAKHRWLKQHSGYAPYLKRIGKSDDNVLPRMPTREEWKLVRKYFPLDGKPGADPSQLTPEENKILVAYLEGEAQDARVYPLDDGKWRDKNPNYPPLPNVQSKQVDLFRQRFNLIADPEMLVKYRDVGKHSWTFPIPTVEEAQEAMRASESK